MLYEIWDIDLYTVSVYIIVYIYIYTLIYVMYVCNICMLYSTNGLSPETRSGHLMMKQAARLYISRTRIWIEFVLHYEEIYICFQCASPERHRS